MSFVSTTPFGPKNTNTDIWITPKWIIDRIGISDLDPCGYLIDGKPIVETAKSYFTEMENGLIQKWIGSIFCNFPYSDSNSWLTKCAEYGEKGGEVIVLCFARTETKAWQNNIKTATGINLINKRIKFIDGNIKQERTNGNAPSCLIAWGEKSYLKIKNVDGIYLRIDK